MNQLSTPSLEARLILVPIGRLNPIAHGVRKTNGVSIAALAASIKAEGLLQNLTVVVDAEAPFAGAEDLQHYQVIAGCRRLRALRQLVETKALPATYEVPCRLIEESQALTASLAENAIREPMHAADEFTAFHDMHAAGHSIEDIAARYGVTSMVVERRLRLANVAPKLFELFRTTNEINLEQMMALAIVDDHKAQERAWFKSESWQRSAGALRQTLTKKEVSFLVDGIAQFVGIPDYEAAGGIVHRDLFSDRDEGFATDPHLLQKLAAKKLEAAAADVRKEGWSWVEVRDEVPHSLLYEYTKATPTKSAKPTDVEKRRVDELKAQRKALEKKRDAMGDLENTFDPDKADELEEQLADQLEAIDAEMEAIADSKVRFDPKVLSIAGAFVTIEYGHLKVHRGLMKGKGLQAKEEKAEAKKTVNPGAGLSESLTRDLSAHTGFAIAAELIGSHGMALVALADALAQQVFWPVAAGSTIVITGQRQMRLIDELGKGSPDVAKLEAERKALQALLPKRKDELFAWLRAENDGRVLRVLAYCVAIAHNAVTFNDHGAPPAAELAAALNLDMAARWQATPENYLSRVSADQIRAALIDAGVDKIKLAECEKMKKGELADFAKPLLVNWLPRVMRIGARAPNVAQKPAKAKKGAKA